MGTDIEEESSNCMHDGKDIRSEKNEGWIAADSFFGKYQQTLSIKVDFVAYHKFTQQLHVIIYYHK